MRCFDLLNDFITVEFTVSNMSTSVVGTSQCVIAEADELTSLTYLVYFGKKELVIFIMWFIRACVSFRKPAKIA